MKWIMDNWIIFNNEYWMISDSCFHHSNVWLCTCQSFRLVKVCGVQRRKEKEENPGRRVQVQLSFLSSHCCRSQLSNIYTRKPFDFRSSAREMWSACTLRSAFANVTPSHAMCRTEPQSLSVQCISYIILRRLKASLHFLMWSKTPNYYFCNI